MLGLGLGLHKKQLLSFGGGVPNPFQNALVAYSLRDLGLGATNVVRVRRDSDNTEQDFTASEIIDGTLTLFCGAGDGFVTIWYDQLGYNDLIQSTASLQPQIVDTGSIILLNGKPSIQHIVGKYYQPWNNGSIINNTTFSYIGCNFDDRPATKIFFSGFNVNWQLFLLPDDNFYFNNGASLLIPDQPIIDEQFNMLGNINAGSTSQIYFNNNLSVDGNTGNTGFDGLTLGGNEGDGISSISQNINEFIIWGSTKSRTDVITNQNNFYNTF